MLNELRQLHTQLALLPMKKDEMSYKYRKHRLGYHMFKKKNKMARLNQEASIMEDCNLSP